MLDKDAKQHLRQAHLGTFEIQTIKKIAECGGEIDWFPARFKQVTSENLDVMVAKGYLEFINAVTRRRIDLPIGPNIERVVALHGSRIRLRFTDEGRALASHFEAMDVKPKVIINQV